MKRLARFLPVCIIMLLCIGICTTAGAISYKRASSSLDYYTELLSDVSYWIEPEKMTLSNAVISSQSPVTSGARKGSFQIMKNTDFGQGSGGSDATTFAYALTYVFDSEYQGSAGSEISFPAQCTLTFKDAARDLKGVVHDVTITYTIDKIRQRADKPAKYLVIAHQEKQTGEDYLCAVYSYDSGKAHTFAEASIRMNIKVSGASDSETFPMLIKDLDMRGCYGGTGTNSDGTTRRKSDAYDEAVEIISGAQSDVWIPSDAAVKITTTDSGLKITSNIDTDAHPVTDSTHPVNSYREGFAVVLNAKSSELKYYGGWCGIELFTDTYPLYVRPNTRKLTNTPDAYGDFYTLNTNYTVGDATGIDIKLITSMDKTLVKNLTSDAAIGDGTSYALTAGNVSSAAGKDWKTADHMNRTSTDKTYAAAYLTGKRRSQAIAHQLGTGYHFSGMVRHGTLNGSNQVTGTGAKLVNASNLKTTYTGGYQFNVLNESVRGEWFNAYAEPALINIEVLKVDEQGNPLSGAQIKLSGTILLAGYENTSYERILPTDGNGKAVFENVPYGNYELEEIAAPEHYQLGNVADPAYHSCTYTTADFMNTAATAYVSAVYTTKLLNTPKPGFVQIRKELQGTAWNGKLCFTVRVTLNNPDTSEMSGTVSIPDQQPADGTTQVASDSRTITFAACEPEPGETASASEAVFSLYQDEVAVLTLPAGTVYTIEEIAAEGAKSAYLNQLSHYDSLIVPADSDAEKQTVAADQTDEFTIVNTLIPPPPVPQTGDRFPALLLLALLTLSGGALLACKKLKG